MNPVLGTFAAVLFLSIVLTGLIWARRVTLNRGSRLEYDWDEYSSEFDDEEDDYEDDFEYDYMDESPALEPTPAAQETVAAVAQTSSQAVEQTDWVMGSDGYWWYHDKVANEWWYKNAEGEIVQHK